MTLHCLGFEIREKNGIWIALDYVGRWIYESENLADVIDWLLKYGGNYRPR